MSDLSAPKNDDRVTNVDDAAVFIKDGKVVIDFHAVASNWEATAGERQHIVMPLDLAKEMVTQVLDAIDTDEAGEDAAQEQAWRDFDALMARLESGESKLDFDDELLEQARAADNDRLKWLYDPESRD